MTDKLSHVITEGKRAEPLTRSFIKKEPQITRIAQITNNLRDQVVYK